jgi:hypothetical protein
MALFGRAPQDYQPIAKVLATARERLTRLARGDSGNCLVEQYGCTLDGSWLDVNSKDGAWVIRPPDGFETSMRPRRPSQLNPQAAAFTPLSQSTSTVRSNSSDFGRSFMMFR